MTTPKDERPLLEIKDLHIHFNTFAGTVKAIDGINLTVRRNETLGIVGESGCGKSVTAMSVLRLNPTPPAQYVAGEILFYGTKDGKPVNVLDMEPLDLQEFRGNEASMIFQEPMTSLNPVMRVGDQIVEAVLEHDALGLEQPSRIERMMEHRGLRITKKLRARRKAAEERTITMLKRIGIADPDGMMRRYPHELSGGMRQRIMIAIALSCNPVLLIADEPTTALDVTIQAQIMELMKELKTARSASIMLITHHLGIVAEMCDRVAVMYAGHVVETASTHDVFHQPRHPYTVGLLKSIPAMEGPAAKLAGKTTGTLSTIPGTVPDLIRPPLGCRFHPRCPYAFARCMEERPPLYDAGPDHKVACHLYDEGETVPPELMHAGLPEREAGP